jgi:hypothetical protein
VSDDTPPIPVRRSRVLTLDVITSVSALVISTLSIYMAWDNGNDMAKLVHANSWPALQLGSGNRDDHEAGPIMGFEVTNAGVGPARVYSFSYLVDGVEVTDPYELAGLARACCNEVLAPALARSKGEVRDVVGNVATQPLASTFLPPNRSRTVFFWKRTEQNQAIWDAVDKARQARRISTRVCYCSVFDECWVAASNTFPPRAVKACAQGR